MSLLPSLKTLSVAEQRDWIAHFARSEITKIFEGAKFNVQVFKMAVKSLQRKQRRREEYLERQKRKFKPPVKVRKNAIAELGLASQVAIAAFMLLLFYLLDQ